MELRRLVNVFSVLSSLFLLLAKEQWQKYRSQKGAQAFFLKIFWIFLFSWVFGGLKSELSHVAPWMHSGANWPQPRWGWESPSTRRPRVARSSRPWDSRSWQSQRDPNGIAASSPRLRGTSYLGGVPVLGNNPNGV